MRFLECEKYDLILKRHDLFSKIPKKKVPKNNKLLSKKIS